MILTHADNDKELFPMVFEKDITTSMFEECDYTFTKVGLNEDTTTQLAANPNKVVSSSIHHLISGK
jgi:hypothetical protein